MQLAYNLFSYFFGRKPRFNPKFLVVIGALFLLTIGITVRLGTAQPAVAQLTPAEEQGGLISELASSVQNFLKFNIPVVFEDSVNFNGEVNINGQPLIGGSGAFTAGEGVAITDSQIVNTDPGSFQNIFKSIIVGTTNLLASGNSDELIFQAGEGISISGDNKTITFSSTASSADDLVIEAGEGISISGSGKNLTISSTFDPAASGWVRSGENLTLSHTGDLVGIGTSSPTAKVHVVGSTLINGATTIAPTGNDDSLTVRSGGGIGNIMNITNADGDISYLSVGPDGALTAGGSTLTNAGLFASSGAIHLTDATNALVGTAIRGGWTLGENTFDYRRIITVQNTDEGLTLPVNHVVTVTLTGDDAAHVFANTREDQNDFRISHLTTEIPRNIVTFTTSNVVFSFQLTAELAASTATDKYRIFYTNNELEQAAPTYLPNEVIDDLDTAPADWASTDDTQFPLSSDILVRQEGSAAMKLEATTHNIGAFGTAGQDGLDVGLSNFGFLAANIIGNQYQYAVGGTTDGTASGARSAIHRTSLNATNGNVEEGVVEANTLPEAITDPAVVMYTPTIDGGTGVDGSLDLSLGEAGGCVGIGYFWSGSTCTLFPEISFEVGPIAGSGDNVSHAFVIPSGVHENKVFMYRQTTGVSLYDPITNTVIAEGPEINMALGGSPTSFTIPSGEHVGKILLTSGLHSSQADALRTRMYDPATHNFTEGPTLTRYSTFIMNTILIPSGQHAGKILMTMQGTSATMMYDPATHSFISGPSLGAVSATPYTNHFLILSGDHQGKFFIIVGGGSSTLMYDPATHSFTPGPSLGATANQGSHSFEITSGEHTGKNLIVLGNNFTDTRMYDSATHSFTPGPSLTSNPLNGSHSFEITSGEDTGKVLTFISKGISNDAETSLYDPETHTYTAGPNPNTRLNSYSQSFQISSGSNVGKAMIFTYSSNLSIFNPGKETFNFTTVSIPAGTALSSTNATSNSNSSSLLQVSATGNVTVDGSINLNGKGYPGGSTGSAGYGPGAPQGSTGGGCGGSHAVAGGIGGNASCSEGSTYNHDDFGSGGSGGANSAGGAGGGGITISSNGNITVGSNGSITANGANGVASGVSRGGGGSGGFIKLQGASVINNGTVSTNGGAGGNGTTNGGGGGASGRVVLQYSSSVTEGTIAASGGDGGTPNGTAGAGDTPSVVSTNPIMYVLGGRMVNNTAQSAISQTVISAATGSVGSFSAASYPLPQSLYGLTAQTVVTGAGTYLYVAGGNTGTDDQSAVYKYSIASAGTISEGVTTNQAQLPLPLSYHSMLTGTINSSNYLWIIGGISEGEAQAAIYRGVIDENGDITSLSAAGQASLPTALYNHSAFFQTIDNNNYLYIIGGSTTGEGKQTVVYKASLDSSGNVSSVLPLGQTQLITGISDHAAFGFTDDSDNTHAYVMGGQATTSQSAIQKAVINTDQTGYQVSRTNITATDLSNKNALTFWIHAGRSGSFMTMEIHNGAGWQACNFAGSSSLTVNTANTWEQKGCDISAISPRDAVTGVRLKITASHSTSFNVRIDDIQALTSQFSGSAATSNSSIASLGAVDLTLNAQGIGAVNLNYDPVNALAGTGGMKVYDGSDSVLFSVDGDGIGYIPTSLGIGTTDPGDHKFYISGGTAYCDQTNCWTDASSRDLKTNIEELSANDMSTISDQIRDTNVYFYNRIEDPDGLQYLGVISEEAPDWITTPDKKAISASAFANFLLAGLKSLQQDVDELKIMVQTGQAGQGSQTGDGGQAGQIGGTAQDVSQSGISYLEINESSVLVGAPSLSDDAKIFLTPEEPIVVSAKRINGVTFEIRVAEPVTKLTTINWWIVN